MAKEIERPRTSYIKNISDAGLTNYKELKRVAIYIYIKAKIFQLFF